MLRRTFGKIIAGILGVLATRTAKAEVPCTECGEAPRGQPGIRTLTEDELRAQYWSWVRGEEDLHNRVVADLKAKVRREGAGRLVHRKETSVFT
jgi:hypothetical protein